MDALFELHTLKKLVLYLLLCKSLLILPKQASHHTPWHSYNLKIILYYSCDGYYPRNINFLLV